MNLKPKGYNVLVRMEQVELVSAGGVILHTTTEAEREQNGHDVGVIVAFGPTAYFGYQGCDGETAEMRAAKWGVKVGDQVEFIRYDGKIPRNPEFKDYRILQDGHIIAGYED